MPILLTSSPIPSSPEERRFREAVGMQSFVPMLDAAAMLDTTVPTATRQLVSLTVGPDALYQTHQIQTGSDPEATAPVLTLSPLGIASTFEHPGAVQLFTKRLAEFPSTEPRTMTSATFTANTLVSHTVSAVLGQPNLTLHYTGLGSETTSVAVSLPRAAQHAHAFARVGDARGTVWDQYYFALPTFADFFGTTDAIRDTYHEIQQEGGVDRSRLLVSVFDAEYERAVWKRFDISNLYSGLLTILRTTQPVLVPTTVSDTVAPVSARRISMTVTAPVWAVYFPGNPANLSMKEDLPRRRLEVFDEGPERPE